MERSKDYVRRLLEDIAPDSEKVISDSVVFINEMLKWNRHINITSITDPIECWEKHIQDSLLPLKYIYKKSSMLDMGSGAGLPAIPLKLSCPYMHITSVDKARKKINFQNHCKRILDLKNFTATVARLDECVGLENKFEVVIARALAPLATLIELGCAYIKPGGILIAMKGRIGLKEIEDGKMAAHIANMEFEHIENCHLFPSNAVRQLIIIRKNLN